MVWIVLKYKNEGLKGIAMASLFHNKSFICFLAGFVLVSQFGCAVRTKMPMPTVFESRAYSVQELKEVRESLGAVGVVSGEFVPELYSVNYSTPEVEKQSKKAMNAGLLVLLAAGVAAASSDPFAGMFGALGLVAILPAFVAVDKMADVEANANSFEEVMNIIRPVYESLNMQESIRDSAVSFLKENGRGGVSVLPGMGPQGIEEVKGYKMLSAQPIDSLLELTVVNVGFKPANPDYSKGAVTPLGLFVILRVRLINAVDNNIIYENFEHYDSGTDGLVKTGLLKSYALGRWAMNDGEIFKENMEAAIIILGKRAVTNFLE